MVAVACQRRASADVTWAIVSGMRRHLQHRYRNLHKTTGDCTHRSRVTAVPLSIATRRAKTGTFWKLGH